MRASRSSRREIPTPRPSQMRTARSPPSAKCPTTAMAGKALTEGLRPVTPETSTCPRPHRGITQELPPLEWPRLRPIHRRADPALLPSRFPDTPTCKAAGLPRGCHRGPRTRTRRATVPLDEEASATVEAITARTAAGVPAQAKSCDKLMR